MLKIDYDVQQIYNQLHAMIFIYSQTLYTMYIHTLFFIIF